MDAFDLVKEQVFDTGKHVEKILQEYPDGDVTVACWEAGQISPNHCHPHATEIYFCFQGGGIMRTPDRTVEVKPGGFVVHPPRELHEYETAPSARYSSASASATTWWPALSTGAATRTGSRP
ncbi:MAG: cupin domain-containing protein [Xanthobacteraceae bacterium]